MISNNWKEEIKGKDEEKNYTKLSAGYDKTLCYYHFFSNYTPFYIYSTTRREKHTSRRHVGILRLKESRGEEASFGVTICLLACIHFTASVVFYFLFFV